MSKDAETVTVTGTALYRERIALPPNAVFEAVLLDVTLADAKATEIARATIESPTAPPFRFTLTAPASAIDANRRYAVRARVLVADQLKFTSDTMHSVLTGGAGNEVEILMKMVSAAPTDANKPAASLTNTYWKIVTLAGEALSAVEGRKEPRIMLKSEDGKNRYSATVGCNQLVGGFTVEGDALTFTGSATTLMACPPPLDAQERALSQALGKTKRHAIAGDSLTLFDEKGTAIVTCEAIYL